MNKMIIIIQTALKIAKINNNSQIRILTKEVSVN